MNPLVILYVALGGAIGSVSRFAISHAIESRAGSTFPWGTLLVNVTGSFLIGLIMRHALDAQSLSHEGRLFLAVGFCGGYTTFSAFSYETIRLLEDGNHRRAIIYVLTSVVFSLLATIAGIVAARGFSPERQV